MNDGVLPNMLLQPVFLNFTALEQHGDLCCSFESLHMDFDDNHPELRLPMYLPKWPT